MGRLTEELVHRVWEQAVARGTIRYGTVRAGRFGGFGPGSRLVFPHTALFGERWISIGDDTCIAPHATLSAGMNPGQQMVSYPVVRIGDRCLIGRGTSIVGHYEIRIGDDVCTGPHCYITDQNHAYDKLDVPIRYQHMLEEPVTIGDGSWLGAGVVVLPGARVGRHVVVAAGSVVTGELPDNCVAAGQPARVVRQYLPGEGWTRPQGRQCGPEGVR